MDSTESGSDLVVDSREDGNDCWGSVNIHEFLKHLIRKTLLHRVKCIYNRENGIPQTSWISSET
jgi:hypothetical protein